MTMIVLRLLSLLGLKSRFRPPNKPFFRGRGEGCRWIRGLRAQNPCAIGIQPVHTRVDSRGLQWTPANGGSATSDFALGAGLLAGEDAGRLVGRVVGADGEGAALVLGLRPEERAGERADPATAREGAGEGDAAAAGLGDRHAAVVGAVERRANRAGPCGVAPSHVVAARPDIGV